jgi:hypothetical protein
VNRVHDNPFIFRKIRSQEKPGARREQSGTPRLVEIIFAKLGGVNLQSSIVESCKPKKTENARILFWICDI